MQNFADEQQQARRAYIYRILSAMYYSPAAELLEMLENLPAALEATYPSLAPYAVDLLIEFKEQPADSTNLKVEYARLFVGPGTLVAAPYGSVYLDEGRKLMGETTMNALEHYQAVGLKANKESNQPPDFIGTELEFMFFLGHCYLQSQNPDFIERQRSFLGQHPALWIEPFTEAIIAHSTAEFYRLLATLTQQFILTDMQALQLANQ
ncbi:TorD/DmsD family molecular chaperone [Desulfurivibrio alkaliphilus]|uniref:Cytoplasmic chaperone TorD family protein n=1 Tax=Desulfurivibrio alkaliphilus (strain DSM 19089 / UNIQEM U267 / AHT2) TaxID=589865 RepID=D6Z635_DESAT|nr:molecular chaperone TorD family protein [Desulfurivibrio alkaliphilus]ADH84917.1 cytoplasmic chaperone TorD family protein [Desulfurivibrio alkaliphilus AHT 2]